MDKINEIKHFEIKCPICGNDDFVLIKEEPFSLLKTQSYVVGCTKCFLTLHFNPTPVSISLSNEEQRKKQVAQIKELKEAINKLELEIDALLKKIELLKTKKCEFDDVNKYREQLEEIRHEKEDVDYRIILHKQELKSIEEDMEYHEDWPDYIDIL